MPSSQKLEYELHDMNAKELAEFFFHLLHAMGFCGEVARAIEATILPRFKLIRTEIIFNQTKERVEIRMSPERNVWIEDFSCTSFMSMNLREGFFNLAVTAEQLTERDRDVFSKVQQLANWEVKEQGIISIIAK